MVLVDIPGDVLVAIEKIVDYNWPDECDDFEDCYGLDMRDGSFFDQETGSETDPFDWDMEKPENSHVFLHILRISGFPDKNPIICAEDGSDFQEYVYSDGKPVPAGTPVGIEVCVDGKTELKLFDDILYSHKPRS